MDSSTRSAVRDMVRTGGRLRTWTASVLAMAAVAGVGMEAAAQAPAATRPSIGKTIKVGAGIYEIVASESTGTIYVASAGGGPGNARIYALDAETLDTKSTIDVSAAPAYGLGINDRTQTLYTTNTRDGSVTAIDLRTGQVIRTITSDVDSIAHMREIVVDEEANVIYASSYRPDGIVWVIDGATNQLRTLIEGVGDGTSGMALDKAANRLYTTNITGGDISVIDLATNRVERRFPAGGGRPTNAAFDPATNRLFVANQESADMTVLDVRTGELLRTVPTGAGALGVRFNPANGLVYVANRQAGTVTVIDAGSYEVIANLETGTHPNTVAIDTETNLAYVTNKARSGGRGAPPVDDPRGDTVTIIRP